MEISQEVNSPILRQNKIMQLHCIDQLAGEKIAAKNLKNILFSVVVGHVSFLDRLEERRILFLLVHEKVESLIEKNIISPVIVEVTSSCMLEVPKEVRYFCKRNV